MRNLHTKMMKNLLLSAAMASAFVAGMTAQTTWDIGGTEVTEYDLVTGIDIPWELVWGPDDHLWATSRQGEVWRIDPATGAYDVVLSMDVMNGGFGEPGLLGMAFHPDFASGTQEVFLVYCVGSSWNGEERLAKFTWDGAALTNEEVLLTLEAGGIHNGSRLLFLPDGTLLMSAGDVGSSSLAQSMNSNQGKILRLNADGSIPADNPIAGSYVFTFGNRNVQGLAVREDGMIFASEHGQNQDDELNLVLPGRNYGWPNVEGACNTTAEQNFCDANDVMEPLKAWTPCVAVNGMEFYEHEAIPAWNGKLLLSVLGGLGGAYERLSVLDIAADGTVLSEEQFFSSFNQRIRDVAINPYTGSVYVAFNGPSYPGSGPNVIKEFRNDAFASSVGETAAPVSLDVFPNPAVDEVSIAVPAGAAPARVRVYNSLGICVGDWREQAPGSRLTLSCGDWASGTYIVHCEQGGQVRTQSLTKP